MASRGRPPSKTRVVGYRFEGRFDDAAMVRLLEKAELSGVVTQWDVGRGEVVWFNGPPGQAIRSLRDEVQELLRRRT